MYVLTQIVPYAHTSRIILLAVSDLRTDLEELLLSIYEEAKQFHNDSEYLTYLMDSFEIHNVLYIGN